MSSVTLHILPKQQATIMVRSTEPVILRFMHMTVHISEIDGGMVLQQCPKSPLRGSSDELYAIERFAGGTFDEVNEKHGNLLEFQQDIV